MVKKIRSPVDYGPVEISKAGGVTRQPYRNRGTRGTPTIPLSLSLSLAYRLLISVEISCVVSHWPPHTWRFAFNRVCSHLCPVPSAKCSPVASHCFLLGTLSLLSHDSSTLDYLWSCRLFIDEVIIWRLNPIHTA